VKTPGRHAGWMALAAGFIIMLVGYAMRNTFTVFYPVIVDDFGWTRGGTAIMFSITLLTYGLVAPVAGGLVDRFNPKLVLSIGGLIVGSGVALCSAATEIWHFYLVYGIMVAVGLSLIGVTPMSTILTDWFPQRRAFVFGLLGAGFGVSLVSAPVFQILITRFGWQTAYVIIGITAAAIIVPLVVLFIRRNRDSADRYASSLQAAGNGQAAGQDWTLSKVMKTTPFKVYLIIAFCNMGIAQQLSIAHDVYILQDMGYAPLLAASVFSGFGGGLAVGTLLAFLSDRLGRVQVFVAGCLIAAGGVALLLAGSGGVSVPIAVVFSVASGFGLGITPPTMFAAVADRYHGRNYGSIQGTIILSCSVGGAVGPWMGGALHDWTGSYHLALILVIGFVLLAAFLMWLVRPRARENRA
jgi:MFS family permease